MKAIIFANRLGQELKPLHRKYCPAMLPIVNKPVLEYSIDDLCNANIQEVTIVVASHIEQIKSHFGNGQKWGLSISYFLTKPEEKVSDTLAKMELATDKKILLARGDVLRSPCFAQFKHLCEHAPRQCVQAQMANKFAGMMLFPIATNNLDQLNWPLTADTDSNANLTEILHGQCFYLDSINNYADANFYLLNHKIAGLTPQGQVITSARDHHTYIGIRPHIPSNNIRKNNAIGDFTYIDDSCQLEGNTIIGKDCYINQECTLEQCIVLDNSRISSNLTLKNCILNQDMLLQLSPAISVEHLDHRLASQRHLSRHGFIEPILALLAVIMTLPLWPVIWLWAKWHHKSALIKTYQKNNKGERFTRINFNVNKPILKLLPDLIHVISGNLNLFGYQSTTAGQNIGLWGPAQLLKHLKLYEEEYQLMEQVFFLQKGKKKYFTLLKQAFSKCSSNNSANISSKASGASV